MQGREGRERKRGTTERVGGGWGVRGRWGMERGGGGKGG